MTAQAEAVAMAEVAARAAAAKLAEDVVVIDVSEQLVITDCFVLASGSNDRQVNAIVDEVEEKMRLAGYKPARREGTREGRWVLLDYVDIVVHIQHRDERDFYALDRLWRDCPVIPVDLDGGRRMRVRRLVMLRHGQTEFNAGSRMQGQLDTDLSELGRAQAVAAAEVLAKRQPLLIVSSDLRRAYDTAVSLGERSGVEVDVDTRLRETHLGDWQGLTHTEVDAAAPGARLAWRDDARWAPHGGESRVDVAERSLPLVAELVDTQPEWGADDADRPLVLVAHGGLIAALTAVLLGIPVDNWPILGGMGNASWVQLSGHSADDARLRRHQVAAGRVERLGAGRQRCPLIRRDRPARPTLLVFADSLSYYGPTGGLPSDDPRIWPNIVAAQLGWDLELIGRIGWTCRDVWWAATQDPRSWAALRTAGAVVFATGGMDSLPSPLPTALRELIRYVRPPELRRRVRDGYGWLQARASAVSRPALPPHLTAEYLEMTRAAIDFNRPGIPVVASLPSVHVADIYGRAHRGRAGTVAAITAWAEEHDVPLVDLKAAVAEEIYSGRANPDGIHWNFAAHEAVAELMLKALAEAGVSVESSGG